MDIVRRFFLMTKIDGRSKKEATRQLDESLKRLKVDMIDLVQHHESNSLRGSAPNL
jgi:aryl-alcohol dehydrogenase-like predicted oxidoreductase